MIGSERRATAVAFAIALLSAPAVANAFCRTSTCNGSDTSQVCTPAASNDCGKPLFWASPCVGFWMQKDASAQVSLDTATQVVGNAFATWMSADCGGGAHPQLLVKDGGTVACAAAEYNQDKGNANVIKFDDGNWPYEGSSNTLALTTVTYDLDTGEIYDADMELNSHDATFTTDDVTVLYDLPSIVQHESGHFLGLAHSPNADATMFASYRMGDTSLRSLSADDVAAICTVYPPGDAPSSSCDDTPRHGFSGDCGADQPDESTSGCSSAPPGRPTGFGPFVAGGLMLLAVATASRRRGRRRARPGR